ncbi:hypothetical protein L810_1587 [Burkholderia sp. AU4i]|nr:hypothetical protein L810_1587 [Burkholderia sp. AU4i]MDW9248978.1 hypothetical protein [Burkholderia cepacia]
MNLIGQTREPCSYDSGKTSQSPSFAEHDAKISSDDMHVQ